MAYVDGEWLAFEARAERIQLLTEKFDKLRKGFEKGVLTDALKAEMLDTGRELKRLKRVHRGEYDVLYFTYEYFSGERNDANVSNLIPSPQTLDGAADFHKELCGLLDEVTKGNIDTHIGWSVGRKHAKTAYLSNAYLCHQIVYRLQRYIIEVSETTDVAGDFIKWTVNQLKFNDKLREDFGSLLHPKPSMNEIDNKYEFITSTGTKVEAKGIGTQMRGLRHLSDRPGLFILDDLESGDNTNTPELRAKNLRWFRSEMLEALDFGGRCIYMGTIVHYDSLLNHVITKRKDFTSRKFPAILSWSEREDLWDEWRKLYNADDPNAVINAEAFFQANQDEMLRGSSVLWAEKYSYKYFMEKLEAMGARAFNQEYLGNPVDEESQVFKAEDFVYYTDSDIENGEFTYYAAVDLAMGKTRGDYSAIITLAKRNSTDICYVVDAHIVKAKPDEFMKDIVSRTLHYQYEALAVESQAFQEYFADELGKALQRVGYPANTRLKQVKQKIRKQLRIESLEPDIKAGRIRFKKDQRLLLEMLELYPNHNNDDGPDALSDAFKIAKSNNVVVRTVNRGSRW